MNLPQNTKSGVHIAAGSHNVLGFRMWKVGKKEEGRWEIVFNGAKINVVRWVVKTPNLSLKIS